MNEGQATLLQGGRVVSADGEYDADVLIVGERIAAVGDVEMTSAHPHATVIDVSGCVVMPGLIDNHTHLSMPFMGMMSSDDYNTGTQAAAAGGVTCLVDFSIQREPDQLRSALAEWQGRAAGAAHVDYGFHMAITNANEATIDDMEAIVEAGVSSFKLFMAYKGELMTRDDAMTACMERARDLGALTMVHAENGDVVDLLVRRALHAGQTNAIHHALTRPEFVEAEATSRAARLAEYTGASLFIVHVTCDAAASEIQAAQQRGVPVSAETCTQYLVNTIDDLRRPDVEGCRYICSPPLRDASNHEPLWDYVRRGILESVSTDHCPFTDEQKARGLENFSLVPNGLPVIQHRLSKLWDEGVVTGRITPSQLVDRTSTAIARRFGLDSKGTIAPGKDADVVVFDPAAPRDYGTHTSFMNVDYDLYEGETASGSVRHTLSRGTMVYDNGEIVSTPGHGKFVQRSTIGATSGAGAGATA
jgi:dihydropyrimidinase